MKPAPAHRTSVHRTSEREPGRVRVLDTTLRDGEQSAGIAMTVAQKVAVAEQLTRLGVDIIEAGFPAASSGDARAVSEIARTVGARTGAPVICALSRTKPGDIAAAHAALGGASTRRIHLFIATSDIHLEAKLHMTRQQALDEAVSAVRDAKGLFDQIQFSPEDASRSDMGYLLEILHAVSEAGADVLNIPDTVGHALPGEWYERITALRAGVPGAPEWSVHCHDDLGLAVANTLAGIDAGAGQVEVCVNGIGERAGNAALEEVVMALEHRRDIYGPRPTGIATAELVAASALVSAVTGWAVPPNKAVVGANAFAHESGIHQHGMIADRRTYEIIDPSTVGAVSTLVIGKHSGRSAIRARAGELGAVLDIAGVDQVIAQVKSLSETGTGADVDVDSLIAAASHPSFAAGMAGPVNG